MTGGYYKGARQIPGTTQRNIFIMNKLTICIDRGGTFTDCIGFLSVPPSSEHPDGRKEFVVKLLSVDPNSYPDAPREGIRRILELATGEKHPRDKPLPTEKLGRLMNCAPDLGNRHNFVYPDGNNGRNQRVAGTQRRTQCIANYERLQGNQSRPKIFDLAIRKPDVLYQRVVEVDERYDPAIPFRLRILWTNHFGNLRSVTLIGYTSSPEGIVTEISEEEEGTVTRGISGELVRIMKKPDIEQIKRDLILLHDEGYRSISICLMHSYTYPEHEQQLGALAASVGFTHVSLSSNITPMIKIVPRGTSATADAYLTPAIQEYIRGFVSGFDQHLERNTKLQFMQSDGGLVPVKNFSGFRAILSGPAAGVVGEWMTRYGLVLSLGCYALTSFSPKENTPVIGFDMGGTNVSRFDGHYEHVFETTTAGVTIQAPQLDINTVAAGGGSRLFYRNGLFVVGPESASAHPGPACYRKGGPLTVSDANLILGRLIPAYFPKIFGPNEDQPLDVEASRTLFLELQSKINAFVGAGKEMSVDEIAYGFLKVANETMCRPIRTLTEAKGHDTGNHILACFGGAGGQHACAIARSLGIRKILIHRHSSILSAYGLSLADVVHESQEPSSDIWSDAAVPHLQIRVDAQRKACAEELRRQGFADTHIKTEAYLNLRYNGTDSALMTLMPEDGSWDFGKAFVEMYQHEFGFTLPDRDIIVDDIRIRGIGKAINHEYQSVYDETNAIKQHGSLRFVDATAADTNTSIYFESVGRNDATPVYILQNLRVGDQVRGPAMIIDATATLLIEPACTALITSHHVTIVIGEDEKPRVTTELDAIQLSIFSHRFMSIAEQMGRTLQKTSISTNIKERLDFSCALFGPDGGLVANAPHIPIHLGSLSHAVKYQMAHYGDNLHEGDVILSNHPLAGGSHLPDISVITPVFNEGKIVFFVASRGHHADIGGISPGSMPPNSKEVASLVISCRVYLGNRLYQEGAAIKSFKLVLNGHFDLKGITEHLLENPAKYPGCSGTRCLRDNISDLKAQVAANHKGITLIKALIKEYGLEVVQAYMMYIRNNAEIAVRQLLKDVNQRVGGRRLKAVDYMDDGTPISLEVTINPKEGTAVFDFEGTGPEVYGNCNAPQSVTHSAIIYCLRSLIANDIPLNAGCLTPVTINIPANSILSPSESSAVVGGNVLTSQRLVDVVLKAFGACAASQGCTNNLTFGMGGKTEETGVVKEGWGYYETIAGGEC
ncbi:hypothetical protein BC936DRAFT_149081 [Jimgerdemannia flammicorona]|uniref:Hydantoinase B/oxoprolinase-domain-containing protein n=1 Tax=Jimgerdemannia flammicorona TaxID=994334 RepID=A0A433DK82_9FUNG|nr:hypothetical protein BC936DRAFT_149081 [Jimgerdemannia flammicorona]